MNYSDAQDRNGETRSAMTTGDSSQALYAISVAGELTGVDPQMLRIYESRGLVAPHRTDGGTRRYSGRDIERINRITMFIAAGLNLAGIEHVFALEAENHRLRVENRALRRRRRRDS
jgi:MerR family transcriptional regulator/heat shock protein HspR